MKVRGAYELIDRLKTVKGILQARHSVKQITNNISLFRRVRAYNDEIANIEEAILDMEFDSGFEFNTKLYTIKEENK